MNITQALNVALPELPAKLISQRPPRVHPEVVFREHVEDGVPVVRAFVPGVASMFVFPPESWGLIQLFDGERSFAEIAELYSAETGQAYAEDTVRDFAASIGAMNFWYLTPQEKNIKLMQKTADERRRLQKKTNWGDLSMITFPAVNPDRFLGWLYRQIGFMYKPWCVALTFLAFAFTAGIFITHWSEVGRDTLEFYNFADKNWDDVAAFWIIATVLLCIHEIGHGLTVKHYGAPVPAMGFLLIYLTPGFYTDTTAGEVKGDRFQRLMIAVAGVWSELVICALVTPIWWGTPPNTPIHDFAYTIILFTGIAVVLINWNPTDEARRLLHRLRPAGDFRFERGVDALFVDVGQAEHLATAGRGTLCARAPSPGLCCLRDSFRVVQLFGSVCFRQLHRQHCPQLQRGLGISF